MSGRTRVYWALALMLILEFVPGREGGADSLPSPSERERLARDEVVFRPEAAPRAGVRVPGARGGTAFVRVPTGPEPLWAILTEPRGYPEIFSGLRSVDLLEETESSWLLRSKGAFGPFTFRYHTRYEISAAARRIAWRLDPSRDNDVFQDTWGWWQLVPDDEATLVVYALGSIPSSWQPLASYFERLGIVQALTALRDAAPRRSRPQTGRANSGPR